MTGTAPAEMHWIDESTFTVRDTTFVANPADRFTPTAVVIEAIMTCATRSGTIDEVIIDPHWALATPSAPA